MLKRGNSTKSALAAHKLAPKKRFGQNFLVNRHTAEAIVSAGNISSSDVVVEVGVGLGALTIPLAAKAKKVIGFEIDSGIIRYHQEQNDLPENVTLIHQDILKADFKDIESLCEGKISIMANLPYSISNPFIFKLIDNALFLKSATIMLQKEVADRLSASPGSKEYGVPTVLLGSCATVKKLMTLGPNEFHPRPKVDSVVIRINFENFQPSGGLLPEYNRDILKRIVRTTFNQRRKTVLNTFGGLILPGENEKSLRELPKTEIECLIKSAGLDPADRPESLTTADFIRLTLALEKFLPSIR